jgi:hypothetical protein
MSVVDLGTNIVVLSWRDKEMTDDRTWQSA